MYLPAAAHLVQRAVADVESGVDFTLDHVDRMYVYVCLGSTTPLGLFQMTGRIRKLRDPVVRCCVQQGISLERGKLPRVLVQDQIAYLQWVDQEVRATFTSVRGEGGKMYAIPPIDPLMIVTAHNEARRINGSAHFFTDFQSLAEGEGHVVRIIAPGEGQVAPASSPDATVQAQMLLTYADVTDDEFAELHARVCANNATEDDKWTHYKHLYKRAWGIARVSQEFIDANGTDPRNPQVHLCMQLLFPCMRKKDYAAPREAQALLRIGIIEQVLAAMGWAHPFDYDKPPVQFEDAKEKLLATDAFRKYKANIRLFDPRAKGAREWNPKDVGDALRCILGAASIKVNVITQRLGSGTKRGARMYEYAIDKKRALEVAALVNLKRRAAGVSPNDPTVEDILNQVGVGAWGELVGDGDPHPSIVDITFEG